MPIVMPIEYSCDGCGLTIRLPRVPGIVSLPIELTQTLGGMPPGWTLNPDGSVGCPDHQRRLVEPVASLADLGFNTPGGLHAIDGGRR